MTVEASWYDERTGTLHVACPVLPSEVVVTLPDSRKRQAYTAREHRFAPRREKEWERSFAD